MDASAGLPPAANPALALSAGAPARTASAEPSQARAVAQDMEAFFLAHTMALLQEGLESEPPFGGGSGERAFQGFLNEAYAKAVAASGGVGLADAIFVQLMAQEPAPAPGSEPGSEPVEQEATP